MFNFFKKKENKRKTIEINQPSTVTRTSFDFHLANSNKSNNKDSTIDFLRRRSLFNTGEKYDEENEINEAIYRTFDELDEMFTYPLTRPWQARVFTKLLHVSRGLSYETLARAIGESPRALAAWQLGDSNPHIGRMMVARINMPMDELLQDLTTAKTSDNNARHNAADTSHNAMDARHDTIDTRHGSIDTRHNGIEARDIKEDIDARPIKPSTFNRYSTSLAKNNAIDARCSVDIKASLSTGENLEEREEEKNRSLVANMMESKKMIELKEKQLFTFNPKIEIHNSAKKDENLQTPEDDQLANLANKRFSVDPDHPNEQKEGWTVFGMHIKPRSVDIGDNQVAKDCTINECVIMKSKALELNCESTNTRIDQGFRDLPTPEIYETRSKPEVKKKSSDSKVSVNGKESKNIKSILKPTKAMADTRYDFKHISNDKIRPLSNRLNSMGLMDGVGDDLGYNETSSEMPSTSPIIQNIIAARPQLPLDLPSPIEVIHVPRKPLGEVAHPSISSPCYRYTASYPVSCADQHPPHEPLVPPPPPPAISTASQYRQAVSPPQHLPYDGDMGVPLLPELQPIYLPLEIPGDGPKHRLDNDSEYDLGEKQDSTLEHIGDGMPDMSGYDDVEMYNQSHGVDYDSDIDGDTDLINPHVKWIRYNLGNLKRQLASQVQPSYLYMFTDDKKNGKYRIMVGVTRNPEKRLTAARRYNLCCRMVASVAVGNKLEAMVDLKTALKPFAVDEDTYRVKINVALTMLKTVSTRYPLHPDFPLGTTALPEMQRDPLHPVNESPANIASLHQDPHQHHEPHQHQDLQHDPTSSDSPMLFTN